MHPIDTSVRLVAKSESVLDTAKNLLIPFLLITIVVQYIGGVVFGLKPFSDSLSFLGKTTLPTITLYIMSALLFPLALSEVFRYFSLNHSFQRSFYLVCYAFIPFHVATIACGLLPKLSSMIGMFALYSYYILWQMLKVEYPDLNKTKQRNVTIISIVSLSLLHWAIVGFNNLIF